MRCLVGVRDRCAGVGCTKVYLRGMSGVISSYQAVIIPHDLHGDGEAVVVLDRYHERCVC